MLVPEYLLITNARCSYSAANDGNISSSCCIREHAVSRWQ